MVCVVEIAIGDEEGPLSLALEIRIEGDDLCRCKVGGGEDASAFTNFEKFIQ